MRNGRALVATIFLCSAVWAENVPPLETLEVHGTKRPLALETQAGQPLDPARVARDVRRLWETGWFDDIRVEASGAHLIFTVAEKPRLYLHEVHFEPVHWKRPMRIDPGATIDRARAWQLAAALRQQLLDDGYKDAKVEPELTPAGFRQVDLLLKVDAGPRYRVHEVHFTGSPGIDPQDLPHALQSTRPSWLRHPPFNDQRVEADLARLRSLYLSRGYFNARVSLGEVKFAKENAAVTISLDSGSRSGNLPAQQLCRCLLEARRESEKKGELDFSPRIRAGEAFTPVIDPGPAYTVSRIDFRGHHNFSDSTLRRALRLSEGELFDQDLLRRSLARLSGLGFFEPLTERDVAIDADPLQRNVRVTISLTERPRGRWSLSGPLGPPSFAGGLDATIAARLPGWGRGALEASTYYATVSLLGFASPLWHALPGLAALRPGPVISLARPYLPGQGWQSGFRWSPQLGWQANAATYGLAHLRRVVQPALQPNRGNVLPLAVPIEWQQSKTFPPGTLICDPPAPHLAGLRQATAAAASFLLAPGL